MYFNVNFNVFFKLIKVHLLVSEMYIHSNVLKLESNKLESIKSVKVTLVHALRLCTDCMACRGSRSIDLPFHDHGTTRGVGGQRHAPAALYPHKRPGTHCTGGCVDPRAGLDRCGKCHLPRGFDPRTVQPVARSLYRLSYPAHNIL